MDKLVYHPQEAAQLLGVGLNKIYELLNQKQIPCVRVGRKYLIPKQALEIWLIQAVGDK